ncbi:MAG: hypothetical protein ACM3JD_17945, partial [Rudaea sp.]
IAAATVVTVAAACGSAGAAVKYRAPTYAEITPGPKKFLPDLSTTIEVPPFPYSQPLPPQERTEVDGLYVRYVPLDGTPTPCKRCAGYRLEGGLWSLYLDRGVFKVFQRESEFEAVGSYTVSGNRLTLYNDPYCEEDLRMVGTYTWTGDGNSLTLQSVDDACSIGLRAKNLALSTWTRAPADAGERAASCQPPNREAAVSDHWKKPIYCR